MNFNKYTVPALYDNLVTGVRRAHCKPDSTLRQSNKSKEPAHDTGALNYVTQRRHEPFAWASVHREYALGALSPVRETGNEKPGLYS